MAKELNSLVKLRTPIRCSFTKAANKLEGLLNDPVIRPEEMNLALSLLQQKWEKLETIDKEILNLYLQDENLEDEIIALEYDTASEFADRFIMLKARLEITQDKLRPKEATVINNNHEIIQKRKIKLPEIELKKFSGVITEWLAFWSLFKNIHNDPELSNEDKFYYLIQSTAENSRARDLLNSYPPTPDNYPLAIESLVSRFGREELLIEVYVRELLSLVLNNSTNLAKTNLLILYDKVETHLRALGTLGVTSEKYAAMLYPLVESCLPEDILRIWERQVGTISLGEENKLSALMKFLKTEVEGEQRIAIAKNTFISRTGNGKTFSRHSPRNNIEVPTCADFFVANKQEKEINCIFCGKEHSSQECNRAKKLSLEEKRKIVKKNSCCYLCLKRNHLAKQCRSKIRCIICHKLHCTIMCPKKLEFEDSSSSKEDYNQTESSPNQALSSQSKQSHVQLQTLRVYLRGKEGRQPIRALIDTGSQRSYISTKAVAQSKCESLGDIPITHSLFGGFEAPRQRHRHFRINLTSYDEKYNCNFEALEQRTICGDVSAIPRGPWEKELSEKEIHLTDTSGGRLERKVDSEIHLLIGADVAGKLMTGRIHRLKYDLVAIETRLGWTLMGKVPEEIKYKESNLIYLSLLNKDVRIPDLWELDRIGITDSVENKTKDELHHVAYEHFRRCLRVNSEGRYEISLPWLQEHPMLPDGKEIAEKRLISAVKKLKFANILVGYQDVLKLWLKEGVIERVDHSATQPGHFLPHRAVVKNSATTKIRPVFDASAHLKNCPSLNQCLATGPNLLEMIPTILTRFRLKEYAVTADIKQAFLQISIKESDRNYLKFLWAENGDWSKLNVYRHCRVVFGLTCSPFLLSATLAHHIENAPPSYQETASLLKDSFYVDNCVMSLDSIPECKKFISESTSLLLLGKFYLRDWRTNYSNESNKFCEPIDEESDSENCIEQQVISVLGLSWNLSTDQLYCDYKMENFAETDLSITKRKILSVAQQVFDPLGFICPFTLSPKLLIQKCWKDKLSWDQILPDELEKKFISWIKQLPRLKEIKVPRWILRKNTSISDCSLHAFADASNYAYAACIYIRVETAEKVTSQLVRAKNRITPLKPITIPRLELLACLIAARLTDVVKKDLKMHEIETFYWTDSSNALSWIKRQENWAPFVANRVKEIRSLSRVQSWRHVPGKLNPADLPSRGCSISHLLLSEWLEGPTWLLLPQNEWPKDEIDVNEEVLNGEKRKSAITNIGKEIPWYYKFSSYSKIIRVLAWIKRFHYNLRKSVSERCYLILTVDELNNSEMTLFKLIQKEVFGTVHNPILKSLQPKLDETGLIRVTTRLVQRNDTQDFRFPILLPSKHLVVTLLILEQHRNFNHAGVQTLMSLMRERFWILQCRKTIRQALKKCINCLRFTATRAEVIPAPLPESRVRDASVFEIIGIDLGGPLYLRNGDKAWFVLFTCAVIRAVHKEVVLALNTETFLLALRKFIARRGRPHVIYSDNATNFVGAENVLTNIDWKKVEEIATVKRIKWRFIPPTAAWWGGWWERLIGMIKDILRKVLGRARLNYDELSTILCEAECIINNRPLTYVSEDVEDLRPLTPALFLQDLRENNVPELEVINSSVLNRRLRYRQKLKNDLRKRFRIEYLGNLRQYSKQNSPVTLRKDQIVLVGNDNTKRIGWPLARILELYPGKDGEYRVARIKTAHAELLRPSQRLYPFEIAEEERELTVEKYPSCHKSTDLNKEPDPITTFKQVPDTCDGLKNMKAPVITRSGRRIKSINKLTYK